MREEASARRYGASSSRAAAIARHIIGHTERVARRSGLPVVRICSAQQRGEDFGSRFAAAIEDVFSKGYRRIITLGTDTPGITASAIRRIAARLGEGAFVTGPSVDGGVYAIGFAREAWDKAAFLQIAWQTAATGAHLASYAAARGLRCEALPVLRDIDTPCDLFCWLRDAGRHTSLARTVSAALFADVASAAACPVLPVALRHTATRRRGPPAAFA